MRLMPLLAFVLAAVAAAGAEPDFTAPPYQEVRKAWLQEKATLDSARVRSYRELLEARLAEAEAEIQEKTATRNVKGMSVARRARAICEESLASVQSNGTFTLPTGVRRELEDWVRKLETDKQAVDQQSDASLATLRERYKSRFAQVVRQAGQTAPADPELDAWFSTLLGTEPKKEEPPPPPPGPTNPPPAQAAGPDTNSPWFAASGEAAEWFTAGRWTGEMMAQDIFAIPVLNVATSVTGVKDHPLTAQSSPYTYEVVKPLKVDPALAYTFRLKRLPDRQPVTLLAWPSAANRGRLEFRTQPAPRIPSPHGFELEAAVAAVKKEAPTGPAPVEVRIETEPAGAVIQLNGKRIGDAEGNPVRTPARLRIPPGSHTLRLTLEDHVAKTFEKWSPQSTPRVAWKMQAETNLPPTKALKLDATKAWGPTEVRVRVGDRVWVVPSGKWTIGAKGELCGPEGYPEAKFPHYYGSGDARQKPEAPYGCLLVRFGYESDPIAVTNAAKLLVPATGPLFLDVNEKVEKEFRKDNRGLLGVNLIVIPFSP